MHTPTTPCDRSPTVLESPGKHRRWLLLAFAVCFTGCQTSQPGGATIHGNVTVDNVPMEEGLITFVPKEGTPGTKVSALIQAGVYQIESDQGLGSGAFRVEIFGLPPGIKAMGEGKQPSMERGNYREIDLQFNEKSRLECNVQAEVPNVQDFQVQYAVRPQ